MAGKSECIIKFSGTDIALTGKPIEEARRRWVRTARMQSKADGTEQQSDEDLRDAAEEQIQSKRENEKAALVQLLQPSIKEAKKISEYNLLIDLAETIENAEDQIVITKADWEKLRDGIEKVEKKEPWWLKCRELFKQLETPEEVPGEVREG
jgi:hypothetical protein